jgi:REP element-mobilizing transposase RayT
MSRPLRIEFPGACYHVTARGNGGQPVFAGIEDARIFLDLLGIEIGQQRWLCHGYCLMETHYHLLIETPEPNLGRGMARLNMRYSQWFGRRHERPGHLFQGRYKAILFEKEKWLLPLARHVVTNPVRTQSVNRADQWRWSSYRAVAGGEECPAWLTREDLLRQCGDARDGWRGYVAGGPDAPSPWDELRAGHYLGGEAFLRDLKSRIDGRPLDQVPAAMADPTRPTEDHILTAVARAANRSRDQVLDRRRAPEPFRAAIYLLRRAGNVPLRRVAEVAAISQGRVSQIQRQV